MPSRLASLTFLVSRPSWSAWVRVKTLGSILAPPRSVVSCRLSPSRLALKLFSVSSLIQLLLKLLNTIWKFTRRSRVLALSSVLRALRQVDPITLTPRHPGGTWHPPSTLEKNLVILAVRTLAPAIPIVTGIGWIFVLTYI